MPPVDPDHDRPKYSEDQKNLAVLQNQVEWLEKYNKLQFENGEKALKLQAEEYERRLGDLNHAHNEAVEVQRTYIPREVYERAHGELVDRIGKIELALASWNGRILGAAAVIAVIATFVTQLATRYFR